MEFCFEDMEEEVMGPQIMGKYLILWSSSYSWEQEAQRGIPRPYPQNKLPSCCLAKLPFMETSFVFLKNFQKRIDVGSKLRQSTDRHGS